jgi:hypothetical protein
MFQFIRDACAVSLNNTGIVKPSLLNVFSVFMSLLRDQNITRDLGYSINRTKCLFMCSTSALPSLFEIHLNVNVK